MNYFKKASQRGIVKRKLAKAAVFTLLITAFIASGVSWWNQSWKYRKPVNVTDESGRDLSNYQVKVTLDTASLISNGKMQSDCGDIRFVNSTDSGKLDYWLKSGCNTASTEIWVKLPKLEASGTRRIYLYYGNNDSSGLSDRTETLTFWDDFEDGTWNDRWQKTSSSEVCVDAVTSSHVEYRPCTTGEWGSIYTNKSFLNPEDGYRFSFRARHPDDGWDSFRFASFTDGSSEWSYEATNGLSLMTAEQYQIQNCNGCSDSVSGAWLLNWDSSNTEWDLLHENTFSHNNDNYNLYSMTYVNGDVKGYVNGNQKVSATVSNLQGGRIALSGQDQDGPYHVDYVKVRKYTSPTPSVSIGSEETRNICDRRGSQEECIVNSEKNIASQSFSVEKRFIAKDTSVFKALSSKASITVSNTSVLSGLWRGIFEITAEEVIIRPGAEFRPEDENIIIGE